MGIEGVFTFANLTSHWKRLSIGAVAGEKGRKQDAWENNRRWEYPATLRKNRSWLYFIPHQPGAGWPIEGIKEFNRRHASKRGSLASEVRVSKAAAFSMSQKLSSRLAIELDFREELP
jgi:hypothetical protein